MVYQDNISYGEGLYSSYLSERKTENSLKYENSAKYKHQVKFIQDKIHFAVTCVFLKSE